MGLPSSNAPQAAAAPNTSSILAALANMARQNTSAAPPNAFAQNQDSPLKVSDGQNTIAQQATALNQQQVSQFPHIPTPVNVPMATFAHQAPTPAAPNFPSNTNPFTGLPPVPPPPYLDPAFQHQLMIIKMLKEQGITDDNIPAVLAAMNGQGIAQLGTGGLPPVSATQFPVQNQLSSAQNGQTGWGAKQQEESRDHERKILENIRSPDRYRRRSRSRSPLRGWNDRDNSPSRRRDGPNYDFDGDSPGRNRGAEDRRGRGNDYRQRSPPRHGRSPTPPRSFGSGEKWIGHDYSIGKNNIKGIDTGSYSRPASY